jgi:hypothetical protein
MTVEVAKTKEFPDREYQREQKYLLDTEIMKIFTKP